MPGISLLLNEQIQIRRAWCERRAVSTDPCLHIGLAFTLRTDERSKCANKGEMRPDSKR